MWDKYYKGRYVLIEPTDFCNCDCIMCTRALLQIENPHNVPKGFMDFSVFKGIIDNLQFGSEPLALKLFWVGESMLHVNFKKMLKYASDKINGTKAYIDLHTNATLLTQEMIEFMLSLGNTLPRVTFSLDAISPETHRKVRRNNCYERAERMIKFFVKEREKRHLLFPRFIFQFIVMPENAQECKTFVDYWSNFLRKNVKRNLADAWPLLDDKRKVELLKEKGIYKEYKKYET